MAGQFSDLLKDKQRAQLQPANNGALCCSTTTETILDGVCGDLFYFFSSLALAVCYQIECNSFNLVD